MVLLISLRVLLSVSANAIQKRLLLDRAGVHQTWILTYTVMLGPALIFVLLTSGFSARPGLGFWRDILIGGGLDAVGNLAMVAALRSTDISIFGPLNAVRPILALIFGWFFLGETPTWIGIGGVAITVAGGVILLTPSSDKRVSETFSQFWKPLVLRTLGLSLGVAGAVFLKRAALVSTPEITVAAWIFCGLGCLLICTFFLQRGHLRNLSSAFQTHRRWLLVHCVVFLSMQWLTIRIFQTTLLAYAFVFFQLGMVLQVFVGRIFFQEKAFVRRLCAALIMAAGSALIIWKG